MPSQPLAIHGRACSLNVGAQKRLTTEINRGRLRTKTEAGFQYDGPGMYDPLNIPLDTVVPVEELQDYHFDVLFSASSRIIPHTQNEMALGSAASDAR